MSSKKEQIKNTSEGANRSPKVVQFRTPETSPENKEQAMEHIMAELFAKLPSDKKKAFFSAMEKIDRKAERLSLEFSMGLVNGKRDLDHWMGSYKKNMCLSLFHLLLLMRSIAYVRSHLPEPQTKDEYRAKPKPNFEVKQGFKLSDPNSCDKNLKQAMDCFKEGLRVSHDLFHEQQKPFKTLYEKYGLDHFLTFILRAKVVSDHLLNSDDPIFWGSVLTAFSQFVVKYERFNDGQHPDEKMSDINSNYISEDEGFDYGILDKCQSADELVKGVLTEPAQVCFERAKRLYKERWKFYQLCGITMGSFVTIIKSIEAGSKKIACLSKHDLDLKEREKRYYFIPIVDLIIDNATIGYDPKIHQGLFELLGQFKKEDVFKNHWNYLFMCSIDPSLSLRGNIQAIKDINNFIDKNNISLSFW